MNGTSPEVAWPSQFLPQTSVCALRRLQREQAPPSPYLFTTERRGPMTPATFRKHLATLGQAAALPFPVHPHMLRHACGYKLAHDGHDTRALQEWRVRWLTDAGLAWCKSDVLPQQEDPR